MAQGLRAAVDIGGTFTDLACFDPGARSVRFEKVLTTPEHLAEGVVACLHKGEVAPEALEQFIHGSTVAINAVIQKTGAVTALVTTAGFADIYEIGRANRPDTYNLFFTKPAPLVPATRRFEVNERMSAQGEVLQPLDLPAVGRLVKRLRSNRVEAVAVCLLHAYANPAHELAVGQALREALPDAFVTLSHEVLREYREYERTSTTVLNAYVGREVSCYLAALQQPLAEQRFRGRFLLMQSNGGVMTSRRAAQIPVAMMESGPAGGVIGAAELGKLLGTSNVIAFDMGGTTAKACLVEDGRPKMTDQYFVGGYRDGYPMRLPAVDIVEVGAGGGSIAWIDKGGAFHLGPRSAGAAPGPACYGRGGTEPTVTDGNLVAGRLNPTRFLGGEMDLDLAAARHAIETRIAQPLKLSAIDAAAGILRLAEARMSFAVRAVTLQRGYDPRRFAMVVFGGAGPLHAMAIAHELSIPTVVIPPQPGHFSALGMLLAELRSDVVRTRVADFSAVDPPVLDGWFTELEDEAVQAMQAEGVGRERITCVRSLEMRYTGQEYTVTVMLPPELRPDSAMAEVRRRFDAAYEIRYGHASPSEPAQIVNLRVATFGAASKPDLSALADPRRQADPVRGERDAYFELGGRLHRPDRNRDPVRGERDAYFEGLGVVRTPVYQRAGLAPGEKVSGPALIEEYASLTVLHPGDEAVIGPAGCIVITSGRAP